MDYNSVGNYFPKTEHLSRILSNFVPFYCDMNIVHTYMFYEEQVVKMHDSTLEAMSISESIKEESILSVDDTDVKCEENLNMSVVTETQEFWNIDLTNSLTNSFNVLNSDFCTNGLVSYDIARKSNGEVEMYY